MARSFGPKTRTRADKQTAAMQLVVMGSRSPEEKAASLVSSYGFSRPEAEALIFKHLGVRL
jgi:hypothetical protein